LLNVIEESFIKVEPTGWGSFNDMAIHEHDEEGLIMVRRQRIHGLSY
jgi:hypothetical protein